MPNPNRFRGLRELAVRAAFAPVVWLVTKLLLGNMTVGLFGMAAVILLLFWGAPDARQELYDLMRVLHARIHLTLYDVLKCAGVSLVFNAIVVGYPVYRADLQLKLQALQLSRDLGDFFGREDPLVVPRPYISREDTEQRLDAEERDFKREFAVRIQIICDQLK